jgi:uncharacterized protein YuzE
MKLNYFPDTDTLYIELSEKTNADSQEISEGIVIDYGEDGKVVGIEIDNASNKTNLKELITEKLPSVSQKITA